MKSAAPKFKGTMLMMNQGGPVPGVPGARPAGAPPAAGPAKVGAGAPAAGAASPSPSRLKGTIVGVAPPMAGAPRPSPGAAPAVAPAFEAPPPPPNVGAPPQDGAAGGLDHHQFGSAQGANPLSATVALDGQSPVFAELGAPRPSPYGAPSEPNAASFGGPSPNDFGGPSQGAGFGGPGPNDGFGGAPPNDGFGGAPPNDGFGGAPPAVGMEGGAGAPLGGPYGAPPGGPYGAPPGGFGAPAHHQPQPGFDPMGHGVGGPMQPYGGGAPIGAPGMMPGGPLVAGQRSWLTTLLLALFVGTFGVHRFYTGHMLFGVLQLVTCGGLGFWTLVDIIFIAMGKFTDAEGRPLAK